LGEKQGTKVKVGSNLCKVLKWAFLLPPTAAFFASLFCPIPYDIPVTVITVPKVLILCPASAFLCSVITLKILVDKRINIK
jgi:hypothetical protein